MTPPKPVNISGNTLASADQTFAEQKPRIVNTVERHSWQERYTHVRVRKSTLVEIRLLRKRLPYSAECRSDDDLILRVVKEAKAL